MVMSESLLIAMISPKVSSGCRDNVTLDTCTTTATILLELCVQLGNISNGHDRDSKDKKNWEEIIEVSESIVPLRFATLFVTRKFWCFFLGMAGDEIDHGL